MASTKKICVLINSLANGGAEKQSVLLAKALQERYETYLIALQDQPQHEKHLRVIREAQINLVTLQGNPMQRMQALIRFFKKHQIEVVFSYLPTDTMFAAIAGSLAKVPHVYGGLRNAKLKNHKRFVLRFLHNNLLDYSIANCYSGGNTFADYGFNKEKMLVVPNGLTLDKEQVERPEKEKLLILSVGRFVPQKDYYTALKAIALLVKHKEELPPFHYRIIGYGEMEAEIRGWIDELGVGEYVSLVINPPNVPEHYDEADIYLCTSIFEGLSNSVMEAMSASLPVVATDVGDNSQLVLPEKNGYLVASKDVEGLAMGVGRLLNSYEQRISYGVASYEHIREHYTFEAFQKKYFSMIEQL